MIWACFGAGIIVAFLFLLTRGMRTIVYVDEKVKSYFDEGAWINTRLFRYSVVRGEFATPEKIQAWIYRLFDEGLVAEPYLVTTGGTEERTVSIFIQRDYTPIQHHDEVRKVTHLVLCDKSGQEYKWIGSEYDLLNGIFRFARPHERTRERLIRITTLYDDIVRGRRAA